MVRKIKYFVARRKFQQVGMFFRFQAPEQISSGSEAVRRARRDRAVLAGPPQHDDEDQGAAEEARPDLGQAGRLPPRRRPQGQHQANDHRGEVVQARGPDIQAGWEDGRGLPTSRKTIERARPEKKR